MLLNYHNLKNFQRNWKLFVPNDLSTLRPYRSQKSCNSDYSRISITTVQTFQLLSNYHNFNKQLEQFPTELDLFVSRREQTRFPTNRASLTKAPLEQISRPPKTTEILSRIESNEEKRKPHVPRRISQLPGQKLQEGGIRTDEKTVESSSSSLSSSSSSMNRCHRAESRQVRARITKANYAFRSRKREG